MARHRFGSCIAACPAVQDSSRLESPHVECYVPVCRSLPARSGCRARIYSTRSLRLSVPRSQQAPRANSGNDVWGTAWRNIRKAAGLSHVRFHDGRHTAITTLAEKGLPDWVIQAQVGQVAPEMMKTYSYIRREALNDAAAALEPSKSTTPAPDVTVGF